ncbi:MAG: hypothetical protein J6S60_07395 [Oscillospiraceae bacterium]|nr:hypothetical protein [Oscillospiraceae bacterium]
MDDRQQISLFNDNAEYDAFVDKFKPKKTTDDCYTPAIVYDAVVDWAVKEYGIQRDSILRPFWPDSDFTQMDYPDGCVVLDNPPFSLLSRIIRHYCHRGIRFFLFAPALTLFTAPEFPVCYLATGADVTYENGAIVRTSFVTNLDPCRVRTVPDLYEAVDRANTENLKAGKNALPKYVYPDAVITAAAAQRLSHYGVALDIMPKDAVYAGALDAQRPFKKSIFGGGFILSPRAAAERAAAERAAAIKWQISERERSYFEQ